MRPVCAVLRVDDKSKPRLVNISPGDYAEDMARMLVDGGARAAEQELEEPGVYRLRISGAQDEPDIQVTRIADPHESVAVATVRREGDESVAIRDVKLSPGDGAELDDEEVEDALTEGVASCAHAIPIGEERAVEIVIPDE